jgi:heme-degrading monooxygenase HmoA
MMNFGPGMQSEGEKVADTFAGIYKTMKGFKGSTFFNDSETGECGALSLWESREDVDAASASLKPKLQEVAGGIMKGPPTVQTFKLYEPKA